ncbi:MAG: outer membrane lipoprotein-sorting protein [Sedimentisphaerales bacterium]|jgi:hypothetical protein|nr:outer membrane lipoprotein-sorting protein [Sedimentisphaerales bacterium]
MTLKISLLVFTIVSGLGQQTAVQDPNAFGLAIATEVDRRSRGYGDMQAELFMILRNSRGQESRRRMRIQNLEVKGDGDRSLCIFLEPPDIKDTALLTHEHPKAEDDQWLYMPALRRVKRISAANKASSFVGSEFSYEDIGGQQLEKYSYRYLDQEVLDGNDCFVIERRPLDLRNSGYSREKVWIDRSEYRIWKVEYYDRKGSLLKTLTIGGYRLYKDRFWRPDVMEMVNHQTGKSTRLVWSEYRFGVGLEEEDLSTNVLLRIR